MEIIVKIIFSMVVITGWFVTWWLLVERMENIKKRIIRWIKKDRSKENILGW